MALAAKVAQSLTYGFAEEWPSMSTPLPKRILDPTFQPVTLEEAKYQVKVPRHVGGHDVDLQRLIQAATLEAETDTKIIAAQSNFTWSLASFPLAGIRLPYRNVSAVSEVKLLATDGDTVLDPSTYTLVDSLVWPELWPVPFDAGWPEYESEQPFPVVITFTAGAADFDSVDQGLKQAILAYIDNIFNTNGEVKAETEGLGRVYEALTARRFATYP